MERVFVDRYANCRKGRYKDDGTQMRERTFYSLGLEIGLVL